MTRQINAGQGSLGKLLKDDAFAESLTGGDREPRSDHRQAESGRRHGRQADDRHALYNRLSSVTERLDQLVTRLNDGRGDRRTVAER